MHTECSSSNPDVQRKLQSASALVQRLLTPDPAVHLLCEEHGLHWRGRIYSPMITVWMFITQVISADKSCQLAVGRLNAWRIANGLAKVSSKTTAFCKARARLPELIFERLLEIVAKRCEQATEEAWLWHGRIVEIIDGWTVTMADTPENQAEYPQMANQKTGCGFPIARMIGLFSLACGAANRVAIAAYQGKQTGETSLLRSMLHAIHPGRILLADRYYASFWLFSAATIKNFDLVARAHHLRKIDFRRGSKQGHLDQVVEYRKPVRPDWMTEEEYREYPDAIRVRHLRYKVHRKGYRTREVTVATTLLDAEVYTLEDLASLYGRRWSVELYIRSLKTQMKMEHLRCHSPSMVRKEIHCHLIGYNLIRSAMLASALRFRICPTRLSFSGARQAIEEFASAMHLCAGRIEKQWWNVLKTISELRVGNRPGRQEPRVLKRRPKQYKLMQKPRDPNRNRYATAA